jgi:50S ribosomal subunit-associated GTPase HflX
MAGIQGKGGVKGRSGPPGNQNAFRHGLAAIEKRQDTGLLASPDESIRQQILDGLISDKGGDEQISTATRILAEVIASDATWLMVFNRAIDRIIANNQKVRENPRGLAQLDSYKRGLVNSLSANVLRYGTERVSKIETLEEIFSEADETSENSTQDCPETMNQTEQKS